MKIKCILCRRWCTANVRNDVWGSMNPKRVCFYEDSRGSNWKVIPQFIEDEDEKPIEIKVTINTEELVRQVKELL